MEDLNKKELIKKEEKFNIVLGSILYFVFFLINFIYFTNNTFGENSIEKTKLQIILSIIGIGVYAIYFILKRFKLKSHIIFIIIASFLGITYFFAIPLGNGNDEVSHYLRIFEISEKYTSTSFEDDSKFPEQFSLLLKYQYDSTIKYEHYKSNYGLFNMIYGKQDYLLESYWNVKLYSPLQYLPQVIGVTFGRVISDNILVIGNCGRIFGYIFWMFICAYAIKIIPNKKTFFAVLCLLPINIISAVCLSGDTVTNSICILFLAIIYRKIYLKEDIKTIEKILLAVLTCMIALCKIVYLPFVFLVLLLDKQKFKNKSRYIAFLILTIILSSIVGILWLGIGGDTSAITNEATSKQLEFILSNPFAYIIISIRTIFSSGEQHILQLTTGNELLCHRQIQAYGIVSYIIGIICLISLLINEEEKLELNNWKKSLVYSIIFITIALMMTAIYIQWTSLFEIGNHVIVGIQGRYLIPIIALAIFVIGDLKIININKNNLMLLILIMQIPLIGQIISYFI